MAFSLSEVGRGLRRAVFGQKPEDVKIPGLEEVRQRREPLLQELMATATGAGPTAGELAIREQARRQEQALQAALAAQGAGARGLGAQQLRQTLAMQAIPGMAAIGGQAATAAGAQRAQDRLQAAQLALAALSDEERAALMRRQLQAETAAPGLLGVLGATGGFALGGPAGAGLGFELGRGLERAGR